MAEQPKKPQSVEELQREVERLTKALAGRDAEIEDARKQQVAYRASEQEVPTGNTVKVTRCKGYEVAGYADDGRHILRPKYHDVEEPTYWLTIDMPPVGGTDIKLNGREYFHGQTYEVTIDEVRTLKDMMYRLWAHERSLHEDNEKTFRSHYDKKLRQFFPRGNVVTSKGNKVMN